MTPFLPLFLILLFLTGLPGADSVSTVSRVTVQRGGSVTIPCHYDRKYKNNVKYWCQGYFWPSCFVVVRTDSPKNNGKVPITDDPAHQVFTVSMKNLQKRDSGYYWCAVEIGGTETLDDFACLHLTVTAGTPGLWVDQQEVTGVEGGSVRVQCRYSNRGDTKKKWCRSRGSCVAGNSGNVKISDDRLNKVFTVTVRRLERKDTGWYWCAAGDLQIPVHITVTQPTTTVTTTDNDHDSQYIYISSHNHHCHTNESYCRKEPSKDPAGEVTYSSVVLLNPQHRELPKHLCAPTE
ncbi:polymeric immunoglobulin receptor-like [Megalops cyprinoides]|uniref:polymeric immunoglobulin receptor-like n=1 Tax=Megalops cyprinoides TaxID=118141 RepID=UPI0018654E28|nr:polymeric immunoglobulin receptor-like [Megalops cyprinoides]